MGEKMPWEIAANESVPDEPMADTFNRSLVSSVHPADLVAPEQKPKETSGTQSEQAATSLRNLTLYTAGPADIGKTAVGVGEAALATAGMIYDAISSGTAGALGTIFGLVPGGESPNEKGARWQELSQGTFNYQPRTEAGQIAVEGIGRAAELGVEGAKVIGSGYAGLAAAPGGVEEMELARQDFRDTPNALSEGAFQVSGSPGWAAAAATAPEIVSLGIPGSRARPRPQQPRFRPERDIAELPEGYGGVGGEAPRPRPREREVPDSTYHELQDALRRGDEQAVLELVNANPAIVNAFRQLGIEFTPGMVSESQAVRQVEAGMQSVPGTELGGIIDRAQTGLQTRARELIDDAGGNSASKATVADDIQHEFETTRGGLIDEAEELYNELGRQIDRGAEVDLSGVATQLEQTAQLLGKGDIDLGLTRMSRHERELFNLTHRRTRQQAGPNDTAARDVWEYDPPPYDAVDRFRRRLGLSMRNGRPFNDADAGELDLWYGQMAELQGRVAREGGYGEIWERANRSVQTRKELEAAMQRTFGQRLQNSVVTRIESATRNLLNGKTNSWDELFNDLPQGQRAAAAATALDTIMFTAGRGTRMSEAFVRNFEKIRRDAQLRDRIFADLSPQAQQQFNQIGNAASGFFRAMERSRANPSGTANANAVIRGIEDGTVIQRLFGSVRTVGERIPLFGDIFRRAPGRSTKDIKQGRVQRATELLSDSRFRQAITEYAAGRVEAAERILRGSSAYEGWAKTLTQSERQNMARVGILAYLLQSEGQ